MAGSVLLARPTRPGVWPLDGHQNGSGRTASGLELDGLRVRSRAMARPLISLLTDFGLRDPSAAICRGVILTIAPEAEVLDISHEVRKYAIRDGALLLWCALPYLPVGQH